jgi:NADPH-dependent 7-cyano-7-deazaguanine reductase QueF
MQCEYSLWVNCVCPVDKKPDVYRVTVRSGKTIPVEDILKSAKSLEEKPQFQEELTQELHRLLAAEVESVGHHSGVKTRIVCGA